MTPEADRFQILCLDGGGIRGLFSAAILAAIEEDLGTQIVDHFDLIAGTSTGGIIALGLGLGLRPKEIVDFYRDQGPVIFRNRTGLRSVLHYLGRKYSAAPLEAALRAVFKDRLLGESTKRLVVPSYNLGDDEVYVFRTPHAVNLRRDYRCPAWKVGLATSAAPTYFPTCRAVDDLRLIDGGIWANNPAMVALVEAYGPLSVPLANIRMLSIGTYDEVCRRRHYLDWAGLIPWARKAPDVLMRATSIAVNNQVRFLLGKENVLRVDPKVPPGDTVLDDTSVVRDLLARARHHSRRFMPDLERFVDHQASPYAPLYS